MASVAQGLMKLLTLISLFAFGQPSQSKLNFYATENDQKPVHFGSLFEKLPKSIVDKFASDLSHVTYAIVPKDAPIHVDPSGNLTSRGPLSRETVCQPKSNPNCEEETVMDVCQIQFNVIISKSNDPSVTELVEVTAWVEDRNDSPPRFDKYVFDAEVLESARPGQTISLPKAEDADRSGFASCHLNYRLDSCTSGSPTSQMFALKTQANSNNGPRDVQLELVGKLDRETTERYRYCLMATDSLHTASVTVNVRVLDVNDNPPVWTPDQIFSINVSESYPPDPLLRLNATDADSKYGKVQYSLLTDSGGLFRLTNYGELKLKNPRALDYDQKIKEHRVVVAAVDNGEPRLSATATLTINVLDENDNSPIIQLSNNHLQIVENNVVPLYIVNIFVSDKDTGAGGVVTCSLLPDVKSHQQRFLLTKSSSSLTSTVSYDLKTNYSFDREEKDRYVVIVRCTDGGSPQRTSTAEVHISVLDENDNAPKFEVSPIEFSIREDIREASRVHEFRVHDPDQNSHNRANRRFIIGGEGASRFQVDYGDGNSYWLTTTAKFDRETKDAYNFSLTVQDTNGTQNGAVIHQATTDVLVSISDVNDCQPRFLVDASEAQSGADCCSPQLSAAWLTPVTVLENATIGSLVATVQAIDCDQGLNGRVDYRLRHLTADRGLRGWSPFRVDSVSGRVTLNRRLDADPPNGLSQFTLELLAEDRGHPQALTGTATLIVNVADVNDNSPMFEQRQSLSLNVSCDQSLPDYRLTKPDDIAAKDADATEAHRQLSYRIVGLSSSSQLHSFRVDSNTGHVYLSNTPKLCAAGFYHFQLEVFDKDRPRLGVSRKFVTVKFEGGGRRPGSSSARGLGLESGGFEWGRSGDKTGGGGSRGSTRLLGGGSDASGGGGFNNTDGSEAKSAVLAAALIVFLVALVALTILAVALLLRWCFGRRQNGSTNRNRSRTQATSVENSSVQNNNNHHQHQQQQMLTQQTIGCLSPLDIAASSTAERVLLEKELATVAMVPSNGGGGMRRYDSLGRQQHPKQRHQPRKRNASLNNDDDNLGEAADDREAAAAASAAVAASCRTMPAKKPGCSAGTRNYCSQQQLMQQHRAAYQALAQPLPIMPHHSNSEGYMACQQFQWGAPVGGVAAPNVASSDAVADHVTAAPMTQTRSCSRMIDSKRPSQPSSLKSSYLTISHV